MRLHAGSLYKNYLVLYGGEEKICIEVNNPDIQWDIYCNDVDVEISGDMALVTFKWITFHFPYIKTKTPMKALGFAQ